MEENQAIVTYVGQYRGNVEHPPELAWHAHRCPELVWVVEGRNLTRFEHGVAFDCGPGSLLVTPPETWHIQEDRDFSVLHYVGFDPGGMAIDLSLRQLMIAADDCLGCWLKQIGVLFQNERTIHEANGLLRLVLTHLTGLEKDRNRLRQRHPALCRAVAWLEEHLASPVTLEETARASGLSPSRLNVLFRREFGLSVMELLLRKRMFRARLLLPDPMLTMAEVAEMTGFSDVNYFIRRFRQVHGYTPAVFRRDPARCLQKFSWTGTTDVAIHGETRSEPSAGPFRKTARGNRQK